MAGKITVNKYFKEKRFERLVAFIQTEWKYLKMNLYNVI